MEFCTCKIVKVVDDSLNCTKTSSNGFIWLTRSFIELIKINRHFKTLKAGDFVVVTLLSSGNCFGSPSLVTKMLEFDANHDRVLKETNVFQQSLGNINDCVVSLSVAINLSSSPALSATSEINTDDKLGINEYIKIVTCFQPCAIVKSVSFSFRSNYTDACIDDVLDIMPFLLTGTLIQKHLLIPVTWFNRIDYLHVMDLVIEECKVLKNTSLSLSIPKFFNTKKAFGSTKNDNLVLNEKNVNELHVGIIGEQTIITLTDVCKPPLNNTDHDIDSCKKRLSEEFYNPNVLNTVTGMVKAALNHSLYLKNISPKSFLFTGPSGTGKSQFAMLLCKHLKMYSISISVSSFLKKPTNLLRAELEELFDKAVKNSPSLVVVENMELIAIADQSAKSIVNLQVSSHLLELIENIHNSSALVFVIGICTNLQSLSSQFLKVGKFETQLHFNVPSKTERFEILKIITRTLNIPDKLETLHKISEYTAGFVGADLEGLCKLALLDSFKKSKSQMIVDFNNCELKVLAKNFYSNISCLSKSFSNNFNLQYSEVELENVVLPKETLAELEASVLLPLCKNRSANSKASLPKGILIYGSPGTGKSKLACALATHTKINMMSVSMADISSRFVGRGERALHEVFEKARLISPVFLYFDNFETVARIRGNDFSDGKSSDRILSVLLAEMDGLESKKSNSTVIVLATTSNPDLIDPAMLRPGRIDQVVFLPPPNQEMREQIIRLLAKKTPISQLTVEQIGDLAKLTEHFSGADLECLFKEAAYLALKRDINAIYVEWKDLLDALDLVPASLKFCTIKRPYNYRERQLYSS